LNKSKFEFQALHGVPIQKKNLMKLKIRDITLEYMSHTGPEWFEYSIRRIKENPKIVSYIIKNMFKR